MIMNRVIVAIGSNIHPEKNIPEALKILGAKYHLLKTASLRKTLPIGFTDQPDFMNSASLVETLLDKDAFNRELKHIEALLGRVRTSNKFGPRTIDLDIVVWNGEIVDDDFYTRDFLKEAVEEITDDVIR